MNLNRILIFGGSGLLGSCFKKTYKNKVITLGRSSNNDVVFDKKNIKDKIVKTYKQGDILIHAAWEIKLSAWENNKHLENDLYDLSNSIFSICKSINLPYVFISSDQVYAGSGPHSENELSIPMNQYGRSKKFVEDNALSFGGSVIRLNFLSMDPKNRKRGWVEKLIELRKKEKFLELYENVFFSPCSGKFASKVIPPITIGNYNDIYNLGCKEGFSKADIAEEIFYFKGFEEKNFRVKVRSYKDNIHRENDLRMDSKKIMHKSRIELENKKQLLNNIFFYND